MSYFSIEENKKLCEKYPFLIVKNRWTGKTPEDYDYSWTEIDDIPHGWFNAFGMQMVEELNNALGKNAENYFITQIKEKYGSLRWYDNGCTEEGYKVIKKYARLSEVTCIRCGQPATKISSGWISPYCDEHFDEKWGIYAEIVNGEIVYSDDEDDLEEESEQLLEEYSEAYKKLAE
jgi:hypothetical protein